MCGRFQLSVKGKHISERFNVEVFDDRYKPAFNCAPGQWLPVITNTEPDKLSFFRWGLIPFWAKDPKIGNKLINARAETLSEKPAYKTAFAHRRCLIPANGFYEWKKDKQKTPYRIFLKGEHIFAMAGLWESWKNETGETLNTFSIITTGPNEFMSAIHQRMPVILTPDQEQRWLSQASIETLWPLLGSYDTALMEAYPVSQAINSPYHDYPSVAEPVLPPGQPPDLFS